MQNGYNSQGVTNKQHVVNQFTSEGAHFIPPSLEESPKVHRRNTLPSQLGEALRDNSHLRRLSNQTLPGSEENFTKLLANLMAEEAPVTQSAPPVCDITSNGNHSVRETLPVSTPTTR